MLLTLNFFEHKGHWWSVNFEAFTSIFTWTSVNLLLCFCSQCLFILTAECIFKPQNLQVILVRLSATTQMPCFFPTATKCSGHSRWSIICPESRREEEFNSFLKLWYKINTKEIQRVCIYFTTKMYLFKITMHEWQIKIYNITFYFYIFISIFWLN